MSDYSIAAHWQHALDLHNGVEGSETRLIHELKRLGHLTADEEQRAWYEEQSREHYVADLFAGDVCVRVDLANGKVERWDLK
jgi:hypothetical protein